MDNVYKVLYNVSYMCLYLGKKDSLTYKFWISIQKETIKFYDAQR